MILYISDKSSKPDTVIQGPSWLYCLQYNPRDPDLIAAGKSIRIFDEDYKFESHSCLRSGEKISVDRSCI